MSKLYIVTRDGKSANDFISDNNLNKDNIVIVKRVSDIVGIGNERYVIIPPLPFSYHWAIRPLLKQNKMINVTKFYNRKLLNF